MNQIHVQRFPQVGGPAIDTRLSIRGDAGQAFRWCKSPGPAMWEAVPRIISAHALIPSNSWDAHPSGQSE